MEIKQLRVRMGWCQSELAQKLSVGIEVVQQWEKGQTTPSDIQRKLLENLFIKSELSTLDMINSSIHDSENPPTSF
jgi:DNA-binding transcriptional regulator YiaG